MIQDLFINNHLEYVEVNRNNHGSNIIGMMKLTLNFEFLKFFYADTGSEKSEVVMDLSIVVPAELRVFVVLSSGCQAGTVMGPENVV